MNKKSKSSVASYKPNKKIVFFSFVRGKTRSLNTPYDAGDDYYQNDSPLCWLLFFACALFAKHKKL